MPFIDGNGRQPGLLIGPDDGAQRIFRERAAYAEGFFVGLHTHHGDESFEVISGEIRFTVGGEQQVCTAGQIVFAPREVEHGFLALTDTVIEIFSEQRMGLYVVVLDENGSRRVEEIFMEGFPSSHEPPPGGTYTPRPTIRAMYATTRHLL